MSLGCLADNDSNNDNDYGYALGHNVGLIETVFPDNDNDNNDYAGGHAVGPVEPGLLPAPSRLRREHHRTGTHTQIYREAIHIPYNKVSGFLILYLCFSLRVQTN